MRFLSEQRDLYAYLHDQTLRMLNQGDDRDRRSPRTSSCPPALDAAWHARGYYGSVSHNVKAIYQRYLGWFDGHPSSLWQHPPTGAGHPLRRRHRWPRRRCWRRPRATPTSGDLRFAAELLKHAVFAEPDNAEATEALAGVYDRLGLRGGEPTCT